MSRCALVAVLGAESTGKSTLCRELADALPALWVPEALRDFCDRHGRTPRADEQAALVAEQQARERDALARACTLGLRWVLVDSAPLATALYSEQLFDDAGLIAAALDHHRVYHHTLLTGLEPPWQADGIQRDGPRLRADFHRRLVALLARAKIAHRVLPGNPDARRAMALRWLRDAASALH